MASPTSSGTWVPPGASRNAKSRSEEKRCRTAATSRLELSVSVIGGFLSATALVNARFRSNHNRQPILKTLPLPWYAAQWFDQRTLDRQGGRTHEIKRDRRRGGCRGARRGRLRQHQQQRHQQ